MSCSGCIHIDEDRTKEPCEPCMPSVLAGGDRINYELVPVKKMQCSVYFDDHKERHYDEITDYSFQGDWLVICGEGFKDYWRADDINGIKVKGK